MAAALQHRKVLVLSNGKYVQNFLKLIERLESQNGKDGERVLSTVYRQPFDAIVLNLHWPNKKSKNEIRGMGVIQPSWMGRLLVITAEINGPKTLNILERYLINGLPQALLWLISYRYQQA